MHNIGSVQWDLTASAAAEIVQRPLPVTAVSERTAYPDRANSVQPVGVLHNLKLQRRQVFLGYVESAELRVEADVLDDVEDLGGPSLVVALLLQPRGSALHASGL